MQGLVLGDPHSFHRGPTWSRVNSGLHRFRVQLNPLCGINRLLHRSVLICICGLWRPPRLDSWPVSQFTVREAIVCSVKVTVAWYLWGFPAGWCPWRRERQSGYFLCLPQWWSGGKAAFPGFSSYGWTTAPGTPGESRAGLQSAFNSEQIFLTSCKWELICWPGNQVSNLLFTWPRHQTEEESLRGGRIKGKDY